jgi:hypothetical protein
MAARTVATATRFPTSRCPQVGVARGLQQALDGQAALKALGPPARPLPSLHFRISRSRDPLAPAAPKAQELPSDELAAAWDFGTSILDTLQTQLGIAKADLPAPPPAHLAPGRPRHRQGQCSHRKSKSQAREHVRRRCPPPRNEAGDSGNQCGFRGLRSGSSQAQAPTLCDPGAWRALFMDMAMARRSLIISAMIFARSIPDVGPWPSRRLANRGASHTLCLHTAG